MMRRLKQFVWLSFIPSIWVMCVAAIARRAGDPAGFIATGAAINYIITAIVCSYALARHALALSKGSDV